jgi:hypothetical protein
MSKKIPWQYSQVSQDGTHHETNEEPIYLHRFQQVLSFYPQVQLLQENISKLNWFLNKTKLEIGTIAKEFQKNA